MPITYHIYGRTSYPQPLTFVKTAVVEDDNELFAAVSHWGATLPVEVVAFPESAIIRVIPLAGGDNDDDV